MKNFRLFILFFISLFTLLACNKSEKKLEASPYDTVNNLANFETEIANESATNTGLTIIYDNQTDYELTFGEAYVIEQKIENKWYQVPYIHDDGVAFIEIAYQLMPKTTNEWTADWKDIYGPLESGNYRLVKDFYSEEGPADSNNYHIATEFTIK